MPPSTEWAIDRFQKGPMGPNTRQCLDNRCARARPRSRRGTWAGDLDLFRGGKGRRGEGGAHVKVGPSNQLDRISLAAGELGPAARELERVQGGVAVPAAHEHRRAASGGAPAAQGGRIRG
eukprot:1196029-Prorocentrum_minimum.AAC.7